MFTKFFKVGSAKSTTTKSTAEAEKFTVKEFLITVNSGKITDALKMLAPDDEKERDSKEVPAIKKDALQAIRAIDPDNDTVLHQLAQSAVLNDALLQEEKPALRKDAQSLLKLVMQCSTPSTQKKSNKRTALVEAVALDHRAIADIIYQEDCLHLQDSKGNTALHYAIDHANDALVDKILRFDKSSDYALYFTCNNDGLFSFALALRKYQKNPSVIALSMISQLYFSLPETCDGYRTKVAQIKIPVEWSWRNRPVWQDVLHMCGGQRDKEGQVTTIDLYLWDKVVKFVNDGLRVWGFDVDLELIYEYSMYYSETPGEMLKEAHRKRTIADKANATIVQTLNKTLAANKEFMRDAQLAEAKYWFAHANTDPSECKDLGKLYAHDRDWIILFKDQLFYVPQRLEGKAATGKEIKKEGRKEKDQASYAAVVKSISTMRIGKSRRVEDAELLNVVRLIPSADFKSEELEMQKMRLKDHPAQPTGATLFALRGGKSTAAAVGTLVPSSSAPTAGSSVVSEIKV